MVYRLFSTFYFKNGDINLFCNTGVIIQINLASSYLTSFLFY